MRDSGQHGSETAHPGQRRAAERAGTGDQTARIMRAVRRHIPENTESFLRSQYLFYACALDQERHPWAVPLTPESVRIPNPGTLMLHRCRLVGRPGAEAFDHQADIGLLAIEPTTRRRMRINGVTRTEGEHLIVSVREVFGNCTRLIRPRCLAHGANPAARDSSGQAADRLTGRLLRIVEAADTFFIGSHAEGHGAECSHRGGEAGFVTVTDGTRLSWREQAGNGMFTTLGNLEANPACALLFADFASGDVVQLTGRAAVRWPLKQRDRPRIDMDLEAAVLVRAALPHPWCNLDHRTGER